MKTPQTPGAPSLSELCKQAGEQAAVQLAASRTVSPGPGRVKPATLKTALVLGSCLSALAVVAAQMRQEWAAAEVPPAAPPAAANRPAPAAPLATERPVQAPVTEPVSRQGNEWVLHFDSVPLTLAVTQLAAATGTTVAGAPLLPQGTWVTLHMRSPDTASAWSLLLQDRSRFSIRCNATACQLWITGQAAAPVVPAGGTEGSAPADRLPTDLELSQPEGSC